MLDEFLLRALAAGAGVALVAGVLGCFVVWRRMAYFGDSLAHSALLGIALGLVYGFNTNVGIAISSSAFAVILVWLQQRQLLATDTLLGILAHGALAIGMVALSFLERQSFSLESYLFGDILTVTRGDIYQVYIGAALVLALLVANWSSLTLMTLHEDLARAEGVNTFRARLLLMFLMTIVVAVAVRLMGILLITSLLIIPAATARQWVRSPEMMALLASLFGLLAVIGGIFASLLLDTPSGPSIVTVATLMFALLFPASLLGIRTPLSAAQPPSSPSQGEGGLKRKS